MTSHRNRDIAAGGRRLSADSKRYGQTLIAEGVVEDNSVSILELNNDCDNTIEATMQETETSATDHEDKMQAVKDLLRSCLQDAFQETSNDCNNRCKDFDGIEEHGYEIIGSAEPEGHQVIRYSAEKWRKESLDCVEDGFWSLFKLTNELERDSTKSATAAQAQTWGIIDEFFQWTETDKSSTLKFRKWQDRALGPGSKVLASSVMQMINDECNKPEATSCWEADLYTSLHCDFLRLFEQRLIRLRNEAILAEKNELDSTAPASTEAGSPLPSGLSIPRPSTLELNSKDSRVLGIARAKLVAAALEEVSYVRPALRSRGDVPKLAGEHPDFMMFEVLLRNKYVLEGLGPLIENGEFTKLAIEIAAAKASRSFFTMQTAYKNFKKYL